MIMPKLYHRSVEIILDNQTPQGSYVASPNFPTYRYCWFRDGAYIAYSMNLAGEHDSARCFHSWSATTILRYAEKALRAIEKARQGLPLGEDYLHTRYTLEGREANNESWANFQLDGFGTWLWAVGQHLERSGDSPPSDWLEAGELVATYLSELWRYPCYDAWEEYPNGIHTHTLAAIYGGLVGFSRWGANIEYVKLAQRVREFILAEGIHSGHFIKFMGCDDVDASLIGLAIPYGVVPPGDLRMVATVAQIEEKLHVPNGGIHRYYTDTYYGGGEWILLAAWLGWYYVETGEISRALALFKWIEMQADHEGNLPEQVPGKLIAPAFYAHWLERWGAIAKPLLWSHAKYIILFHGLQSQ